MLNQLSITDSSDTVCKPSIMQKLFETMERLHDSHAGGEEEAQSAYDDAMNAVFSLQLECHRHTQAHKSKKDGSTKWSMIEMWPMLVMTQPSLHLPSPVMCSCNAVAYIRGKAFVCFVPSKTISRVHPAHQSVLYYIISYIARYLLLMECMYRILHSALMHVLACYSVIVCLRQPYHNPPQPLSAERQRMIRCVITKPMQA